ncbi:hypothetical protein CAPTEDRAFT_197913 [Capitella teleta]|uniref:Uncharacterized protein n=1 Tax=Capitella teleta TaxID=283909 RepID=R7UE21_CAPTE|nr:hypothetical protein CAPTEDRAFT_197913 [Capitella teleta]|eukprot:ELU01497.1 hypothetical protein CAPTEDRAFT_197913 [Capitella teleta]
MTDTEYSVFFSKQRLSNLKDILSASCSVRNHEQISKISSHLREVVGDIVRSSGPSCDGDGGGRDQHEDEALVFVLQPQVKQSHDFTEHVVELDENEAVMAWKDLASKIDDVYAAQHSPIMMAVGSLSPLMFDGVCVSQFHPHFNLHLIIKMADPPKVTADPIHLTSTEFELKKLRDEIKEMTEFQQIIQRQNDKVSMEHKQAVDLLSVKTKTQDSLRNELCRYKKLAEERSEANAALLKEIQNLKERVSSFKQIITGPFAPVRKSDKEMATQVELLTYEKIQASEKNLAFKIGEITKKDKTISKLKTDLEEAYTAIESYISHIKILENENEILVKEIRNLDEIPTNDKRKTEMNKGDE